jgi:hypothetical protein
MSAARGRANHGLYLARILLDAWREVLGREEVPAAVLSQAFLPAVRQHLVEAYGWFLLAVMQVEPLPERPPAGCSELPPVPEGKAVPGEIRELAQLESGGWLARMCQPDSAAAPTGGRRPGNLAVAASAAAGPDEAGQWLRELGALFDRMGDSLDEY